MADGSIQVALRCRSLNKEEESAGFPAATYVSNQSLICVSPDRTSQRSIDADFVFDGSVINEKVFIDVITPLISKVTGGINACLVVTGSPGAGKTHSLFGNSSQAGLLRRICEELFNQIKVDMNNQYFCSVKCAELRKNAFVDLLQPNTTSHLELAENRSMGSYISGLSEIEVKTSEELLTFVQQALRVEDALSNRYISKAHVIIDIHVESRANNKSSGRIAMFRLVSLESTWRSQDMPVVPGMEPDFNWDSLIATANSLAKLEKEWMVPYASSPLTRLLKLNLGGSCFTAFLVCLSPIDPCFEYNRMLCDLSPSLRQIRNIPSVNNNLNHALIQQQRLLIKQTRDKLDIRTSSSTSMITHDVDIRLVTTLNELTEELDQIKKQSWEFRQESSIKVRESRLLALEREGLLWVLEEPLPVESLELVTKMEKERWKLVQLKKKIKDAQDSANQFQNDYGQAYQIATLNPSDSATSNAQTILQNLERANADVSLYKDKFESTTKSFEKCVRDLSREEESKRRIYLPSLNFSKLQKAKDDLDWSEMDAIKDGDDKLAAKRKEIENSLAQSNATISITYPDDSATLYAKDVKSLSLQWAAEKSRLQSRDADIKWERDYFMGKLLENDVRHKIALEKLQDQMLLMFKEYRRHFEEQKHKMETNYRSLIEDSVHDTLHSNMEKRQLEDKLRELTMAKP